MVIIYSQEYSIIGVAPTLLSMYKSQMFFLVLLKFDFLCSVSAFCHYNFSNLSFVQVSFALFNIGVPDINPMLQYLALGLFLLVSTLHWTSGRFAVSLNLLSFFCKHHPAHTPVALQVIRELKSCLFMFVSISTLSLLWVPLQVNRGDMLTASSMYTLDKLQYDWERSVCICHFSRP